jgi:carbon-monoxide dehydrogenase medium subunit
VKPAPFEYHAPSSAAEVVKLLAELGDGAKVIAGGQSLLPMLALRLAYFDHLVDLRHVAELRGIERRGTGGHGESVWIGGATTQAAIGASGTVSAAVPLLSRATPLIGHFQIRNRGTIGGSLAHAEASAEYPAVALTLDAVVETLSPRGQRAIPAAEFFTGIWSTALEPDELLTGVRFPVWARGASTSGASTSGAGTSGGGGVSDGSTCGFAVEEFARRPGDFAIAGATVAVQVSGSGQVTRCGIGLFGLGPTPLRARTAEAGVTGTAAGSTAAGARNGDLASEIGAAAVAELDDVPDDLHGSAAYRKKVGAAMVAAAWRRAIREATGGSQNGRVSEGASHG